MMPRRLSFLSPNRTAGLALLLLFCALFGATLPAGGGVAASNQAWLAAVRSEIGRDLDLLAEVLAFLNILSSADIGVNLIAIDAHIRVGQTLSVLNDTAERALLVVLAAGGLIEFWGVFLGLCTLVAPWALKAVILGCSLTFLVDKSLAPLRQLVWALTRVFAMLFLTAGLIAPHAFNLTGLTAEKVINLLPGDLTSQVENLHDDMIGDHTQSDPLRFWRNKANAIEAFRSGHDNLPHKIGFLRQYLLSRLIHALSIGLMIPFAALLLLWLLARRLFGALTAFVTSDW